MPFGRKRALYQLIGSKKAEIQILRDHIEQSNRRINFSFVINLIIWVSSNSDEEFRNFSRAVWSEEAVSCLIANISNIKKTKKTKKKT